ncbi:MAG: hypothetical protein ACLS6G_01920 [Christensenellales bacterium]
MTLGGSPVCWRRSQQTADAQAVLPPSAAQTCSGVKAQLSRRR